MVEAARGKNKRERERWRSLHLAISLPSPDPWLQCTRSRDHVLFHAANGTDRRDPRAHADAWAARYIRKRPSDPFAEQELRYVDFSAERKGDNRGRSSEAAASKKIVCSLPRVSIRYVRHFSNT